MTNAATQIRAWYRRRYGTPRPALAVTETVPYPPKNPTLRRLVESLERREVFVYRYKDNPPSRAFLRRLELYNDCGELYCTMTIEFDEPQYE